MTIDDELDDEETWEEWFASLPPIPGEPPPIADADEERRKRGVSEQPNDLRMLLRALVEATHSYAERPLGAIAARYIRWLRNERGATAATVRDYEGALGRIVVLLDEMGLRELVQVTTDDLRLVIDGLLGEREPRTRAKVTSIVRSFLEWCVDEQLVDVSPAARIRRPELSQKAIPLLPEAARDRLLAAAPRARDVFALSVPLDLGVSRNELRTLRVRDVDLARRMLVVMGKGQKARALPLRGGIVLAAECYLLEDMEGLAGHPSRTTSCSTRRNEPRPKGLLGRPDETDGRTRRAPLVVPDVRACRACREGPAFGSQPAPVPPRLRARDAPRGQPRSGVAGARPCRPRDDDAPLRALGRGRVAIAFEVLAAARESR